MMGQCFSSTKIISRLHNGYDYNSFDISNTLWQAIQAFVLLSSI